MENVIKHTGNKDINSKFLREAVKLLKDTQGEEYRVKMVDEEALDSLPLATKVPEVAAQPSTQAEDEDEEVPEVPLMKKKRKERKETMVSKPVAKKPRFKKRAIKNVVEKVPSSKEDTAEERPLGLVSRKRPTAEEEEEDDKVPLKRLRKGLRPIPSTRPTPSSINPSVPNPSQQPSTIPMLETLSHQTQPDPNPTSSSNPSILPYYSTPYNLSYSQEEAVLRKATLTFVPPPKAIEILSPSQTAVPAETLLHIESKF